MWHKITNKEDPTDVQLVETLEGVDPEAYDSVEMMETEPSEVDLLQAATLNDPVAAEAIALRRLDEDAARAMETDVPGVRRHIAIVLVWNEVQRLKLAQATGNVPADVTERRKQFPTLMALVTLSGNTLAQVATAIENRLWDRVRRIALWEAKLLLGHDAIRAAPTTEDKFGVAGATNWSE